MNPNTAIDTQNGRYFDKSSSILVCLHCGRPGTYVTKIDDEIIPFCCSGCEGVHRLIHSSQLNQYYGILHRLNLNAPPQSQNEFSSNYANASYESSPNLFKELGSINRYAVFVPAFNCAACIWLVEKVLQKTPGLHQFDINLEDRILRLTVDPASADQTIAQILDRLGKFGYHGFPSPESSVEPLRSSHTRQQLVKLGVAAAIFANVMLFSSSVYLSDLLGGGSEIIDYFNGASLFLTVLSLSISGKSIFRNSLVSLKSRTLHIDLPISIAIAIAFLTSTYHMAIGEAGVYFDSITGLVFFLLLGRYLADHLSYKASKFMGSAGVLLPKTDSKLAVGDHIYIDKGAIVPADGILVQEIAEVSEAPLTGESTPILKASGETIYCGSLNLGAPMRIRVTAEGQDNRVSRMTQLAKDAALQKSNHDRKFKLIAKGFIMATLVFGTLGGILWIDQGVSVAFEVICSVLIVTCPCAFAMALPLMSSLSLKRCWNNGIIVKNLTAFELVKDIDTIAFDKTGTLTTGRLSIQRHFECGNKIPGELMYCIHAMTESLTHPVCRALHRWSEQSAIQPFKVTTMEAFPGKGSLISGQLSLSDQDIEVTCHIGSLHWVAGMTSDQAQVSFLSSVAGGIDGPSCAMLLKQKHFDGSFTSYLDVFQFHDEYRLGAADVIDRARKLGLSLYLLSGDRQSSALKQGRELGFATQEIKAERSPEDKMNFIRELQSQKRRVMMLGDGLNDIGVMNSADVSVGVLGGMDLTLQNADMFLAQPDLKGVVQLLEYSAYHGRSVRLILCVSVIYNLIAIGLALANIIHPLVAALIMPLSSLTVILIAWFRNGDKIWKSSMSSCPLPSPLLDSQH